MYDSFFKYIEKYSKEPLSSEAKLLINEIWLPKTIRKKQFLLQEGDICKYACFIIKGAMRQYVVDESGTEKIVQLAIENWWITDRESFFKQEFSKYNIDAWEDSDVLLLPYQDLERFQTIPAVKEMFWQMDQNNHFATQNRLVATLNLPASERYEALSKAHPEFIQRFPQHIIASYLGITKETLSRVRAHIKHK